MLLGQFKLLPQAGRNSSSAHLAYCSTLAMACSQGVVTGRDVGRQQRLPLAGTCPRAQRKVCTGSSADSCPQPSWRDMPLRWCPQLISQKATPALWLGCSIQSIPNQFCHANVPDAPWAEHRDQPTPAETWEQPKPLSGGLQEPNPGVGVW